MADQGGNIRSMGPYLFYEDAAAALEWLHSTLGFTETVRYVNAVGVVQEAEMLAGDTTIQMAGMGDGYWAGQPTAGPSGVLLIVYVDDVDAHWRRARDAGIEVAPPEDKPYAARVYSVTDPGGYEWTIWQHLAGEISLEEGWQEIRS